MRPRPNMLSTQLGGIANLALLAPIEPGFVVGFETVTYARRLEALLQTLNAIRLASREATVMKSPFPDSVGRFGILHSFRYAIVPPKSGSARESAASADDPHSGLYRLSLNVTFDGGWEPYMRVIYRDLGTLLDAIFCNCVGYQPSRTSSFDAYTRWVRDHESSGGLFYTESSMTVMDQRYLSEVERIHREHKDPSEADAAIAGFALKESPSLPQALVAFFSSDKATQADVQRLNLKALKALHDLRPFFPKNKRNDDQYLLRFTRRAMREFVGLLSIALVDDEPPPASLVPFQDAIKWVLTKPTPTPLPPRRLTPDPSNVQAGIVSRYDDITHGCLVLLRVTDAAKACKFLAELGVSVKGKDDADEIRCNVAFTLQGLKALKVPARHIDVFPQEFIEGMEARAGLLGDVRTNHPTAWRRPCFAGTKTEIDLDSVHVVVQYRVRDEASTSSPRSRTLVDKITELRAAPGLSILSTEEMRSYPETPEITREHFGFRDGISQPIVIDPGQPAPASTQWSDGVTRGEIFLGYSNGRGDGPFPPREDPLLDDGCFLVLRKIRQCVDTLDSLLRKHHPDSEEGAAEARTELKERMMGRRQDGRPLVTSNNNTASGSLNDFNYGQDPNGAQCPFHSHARRTNPRSSDHVPRIIRRGMSYGPRDDKDLATERGLYFMAYCASIAEQFEVIQRWVTGGNSSGVLSTHSDPFLGVPKPGEPRVYRVLDGDHQVVRVELGEAPLTELQWGMYLFVPSLKALKGLDKIVNPQEEPQHEIPQPYAPSETETEDFKAWQRALEDPSERDAAWLRVRQHDGGKQTDYGLLVASQTKMIEVLKDDGSNYSVRGYGQRLAETIGKGYLGLDAAAHDAQAETPQDGGVNQAIADITAKAAFDLAVKATSRLLGEGTHALGQTSGGRIETPIDIVFLSEQVLAALCSHWFGLPDAEGKFMVPKGRALEEAKSVHCPGHFFSVARYVFSPHPSAAVEADAKEQGVAIKAAVKAFLDAAKWPTPPRMGPLAKEIVSRLAYLNDDGIVANTLAGVMLGFPPTVHGNFVRIVRAWLELGPHADRSTPEPVTSVWNLQTQLIADEATPQDFVKAEKVLRGPLIAQMRKAPIPEMIWRKVPKKKRGKAEDSRAEVVLGLAGVMQDPTADKRLMFGGARTAKGAATADPLETIHACPGYEMAIGVMLGMMTTLLLAGTLRPTASPTIVTLVT